MYNVIITGSRNFQDYDLLKKECDLFLQDISADIAVISGGRGGADKLGERYAKEKSYWIRVISDYSDKFGDAEYTVNEKRAREGDALIAFWDGSSGGTKNMIEVAKKCRVEKIKVVNYK